ncbi:RNA dependent RNA polymerase [Inconstantimicrobium porci]|uniref:RNA-directed RNA polymerase n=1 Tax=Inconstantimicrobium porci TaxID=2652291 RepID=A0A7X2N0Z3_9CLOT|nr:hypothetical protein [Inconstantimicrobium porci]MSR92693.1 hypothetical protein [Inconstantimicrobium porci]
MNTNKNITVSKLRKAAKIAGVKGGYKMNKAELLSAFEEGIEYISKGLFTLNANALPDGVYSGAICNVQIQKQSSEFITPLYLNHSHKQLIMSRLDALAYDLHAADVICIRVAGAKIMKIDSVKSYLYATLLYGEKDGMIDFSAADIDGFLISKEVLVSKKISAHDDTFFLTNKGNIVKTYKVSITNSLFLSAAQEYADSQAVPKKRGQYKIVNANIEDLVYSEEKGMYVLPSNRGHEIKVSSNRIYRSHCDNNNEVKDILVFSAVPKLLGFSGKAREEAQVKYAMKAETIIYKGFLNLRTNKIVKVCAQSPAQARCGKYYFTSLNVEALRREFIYGYDFGDKCNLAKRESRYGLATTTAIKIHNFNPKVKVIDDPVKHIKADVVSPTSVDNTSKTVTALEVNNNQQIISNIQVVRGKDIEITPNDGGGCIELLPAVEIAWQLGLISTSEKNYFNKHYQNMAELTLAYNNNDINYRQLKLIKIILKMPSAYQIRYAGDKGMLLVFPFSEYRPDLKGFDIIEGSGMRKYELDDYSNVSFEICNVPKKHKDRVQMSYQFLQSLDIDAKTLCDIADEAMEHISSDIFVKPEEALKFLGLVSGMGDEGSVEFGSKVSEVLATYPEMINDKFVQDNLRKLVGKYLYSLAFGKLPVKGAYHFLFSDPFDFFGITDKRLAPGTSFMNNEEGEVACFRSPMIFKSEVQKTSLVKNNDLWFIHDIIIFNAFDPILMALGGADIDGDKAAVIKDARIIDAVSSFKFIPEDVAVNANISLATEEALLKYFVSTSKPSQVGLITNWATIFRDMQLDGQGNYDSVILALRFLQGWEIDRPKTGATVVMPELKIEVLPEWLFALQLFNKDSASYIKNFGYVDSLYNVALDMKKKIYASKSPLNMLFRHVEVEAKKILSGVGTHYESFSTQILSYVNVEKATELLPAVQELEKSYRHEIASIMQEFPGKQYKEERFAALTELYDSYRISALSISDDTEAVAAAAYYVCYNKESGSDSRSFVWNVLYNELMRIIQKFDSAKRLVRLPKFFDVINTVEVFNNSLIVNDIPVRRVSLPTGNYKVFNMDNEYYILVHCDSHLVEHEIETIEDSKKQVPINLAGFVGLGFNANDVIKILKENTCTLQMDGKYAYIICNGKKISGITSESSVKAIGILNKKLKLVESEKVWYKPTKITDKTMWYDKDNNIALKRSFRANFNILGDMDSKDKFESTYYTQDNIFAVSDEEIAAFENACIPFDDEDMVYDSSMACDMAAIEEVLNSSDDDSYDAVIVSDDVSDDVSIEELAKQQYNIDISKIEKPANADNVEINLVSNGVNITLFNNGKSWTFFVLVTDTTVEVQSKYQLKDETIDFLKKSAIKATLQNTIVY